MARSSGCNKAGYRAATNRRCQNNGCLANGDAFIQAVMIDFITSSQKPISDINQAKFENIKKSLTNVK
ncbi:hypothetical protein DEN96_03025 [Escherichia coli]|nr:hypothetical protein AWA97_20755 [Escherichia coli O104:H21 str. CFSAN002236]TFY14189.1 hypothetical protein DEN96_03025 [Escherichia coli]